MSVDKNITILLVEDSAATRKMEIMILKKIGFSNIVEAIDGVAAKEKLEAGTKIDLIVSDWNMPNMSGFELLEWVRATEGFTDIPFIMATGQGERKQAEVAKKAGVSGMVPKPFTPDDMSKIIEEVFEHGKAIEKKSSSVREPIITASGKVKFQIAHIQITDHLVLGVLKHLIKDGAMRPKHFELETICATGWNTVQDALHDAEIDAGFVLAPIAMDTYAYDVPIKMVMLAHKNGSIMVRNKRSGTGGNLETFLNKAFYIPHQLSIHHMLSHMYLTELGLHPGVAGEKDANVFFEVVPPVKMPEFLASNENTGGYMVAEPLGTKAIAGNVAELQFLSAEAWDSHPCCVVTFRQELIEQHQEAVQEFCNLLVEAGKFISRRPETAAEIGVHFLDPEGSLGLTTAVLKNVLTEPMGIKTDDLYPVVSDLKRMNDYMVNKMGVGTPIDVDEFVDLRFANVACAGNIPAHDKPSGLKPGTLVQKVHSARSADTMAKVMLDKEGKYLIFEVAGDRYGIGIMRMKEIIGLCEITTMPNKPEWFRGVINLRDQIVPVIDLKVWFGYGETEFHDRTSIIVVETAGMAKSEYLGIVVDSVAEIVDITAKNVESTPLFGASTRYILAMAKIGENVNILLDIDKVVGSTAHAIQ